MSDPSQDFWANAREIHHDMENLVNKSGISVNIVATSTNDPVVVLQVTRANLTRIQDAIDAESS